VAALRIVEAFDVVEDGHPGLRMRAPLTTVDQLALERGEERFGHGVVEAVADGAHRGRNAGLTAATAEGQAGVLRTVIGVVDQSSARSPIPQRHLQCVQHQLRPEVVGHTPADHTSRIRVNDHRQVEEPLPRREIGDIGAPEGVWLAGGELALHQVVAELGLLIASCGFDPSPPTDAAQVRTAHQAGDTLTTAVHAVLVAELSMDPRHAIRTATACMDLLDRGGQPGIRDRAD
jgi:hypothetical protein